MALTSYYPRKNGVEGEVVDPKSAGMSVVYL
jgi:hypothetical protein